MIRLLVATAALALTGCATGVDVPFDGDLDGLLDHEEEMAGTDPTKRDSDGDNHLDGDEWFGGTDPNDPMDYPYHGGWEIDGDCREDISGTGTNVGDIAQQFGLVDQFGDTVRLHDFCGKVVVLKRSAGWCGACRGAEPDFVAMYEEYKDRGFIAISLILEEDERGVTPGEEFIQAWTDQYGATHPVLADDMGVGGQYEKDGGIPSYVLIGPGAELIAVDEGKPSAEVIEELLP